MYFMGGQGSNDSGILQTRHSGQRVLGQAALQTLVQALKDGGVLLPCVGSLQASSVFSKIFPRALFDMFLKRNGDRAGLHCGCHVLVRQVGLGGP